MHLHIHSLQVKNDSLCELLNIFNKDNCHIHILLLCETYINNLNLHECMIPGYSIVFKRHSDNRKGGGVAILIDNSFKFTKSDDISIFDEDGFESCFIGLTQSNVILGEIYRVPNTSISSFLAKYKSVTDKLIKENKMTIVGTDQNLDYLKFLNKKQKSSLS